MDVSDDSSSDDMAEYEALDADLDDLLKEATQRPRVPRIFRKRWDSEYLTALASQEGSFLSEYRLDPHAFQLLHDILGQSLFGDIEMARRGGAACGSAPVSSESKLGITLIMLG